MISLSRLLPSLAAICLVTMLRIATADAAPSPAQGFGAETPGGAGKPIVRVTNLNNAGPGSLRAALSGGNRTIVFDVAGDIVLTDHLYVGGPFVTIDGFSAPPPGITLRDRGLAIRGSRGAHDVIVRGLRVRDAVLDGLQVAGAYNVLIEYVSVDSSGDGNLDITEKARDVTVAWSILSGNVKNMLIKYGATRITLHHNVFVENGSRNPQIRMDEDVTAKATETTVDMRNNVIANWVGYGTLVWYGPWANVVNNYYAESEDALQVISARAYTAGNVSADGKTLDRAGTERVPFPAPFVDTTDACSAADLVLKRAGVRPADDLDRLSVSHVTVKGCASVPTLTADVLSLSFTAALEGPDPAAFSVQLGATPDAALPWGAAVSTTSGGSWLRATPTSGVTPATLKVFVSPFGLAPGSYQGNVVVTPSSPATTSRTIVVSLTVTAPAPDPGSDDVTASYPVSAAVDDGREDHAGVVKTATATLPVGHEMLTALRFAGVGIPRGAVIRSAVLYLLPMSSVGKPLDVRYLGERSGDSRPLPRAGAPRGELSARPKTAAFVDDRPPAWTRNEFVPSPELGAIVQEIVSQPEWRPGNSLTLFIADQRSAGTRFVGSFESRPGSTNAAVLVVTYR
jgi:pectate lyase